MKNIATLEKEFQELKSQFPNPNKELHQLLLEINFIIIRTTDKIEKDLLLWQLGFVEGCNFKELIKPENYNIRCFCIKLYDFIKGIKC